MSISEKRLKAIAGGEPFFPGEIVAMALELLANSKETLQPEYPETLPCPVVLEPGFRFGKGVGTHLVLRALKNRAERYAELDAMGPEARAEHDAAIAELRGETGLWCAGKNSRADKAAGAAETRFSRRMVSGICRRRREYARSMCGRADFCRR